MNFHERRREVPIFGHIFVQTLVSFGLERPNLEQQHTWGEASFYRSATPDPKGRGHSIPKIIANAIQFDLFITFSFALKFFSDPNKRRNKSFYLEQQTSV